MFDCYRRGSLVILFKWYNLVKWGSWVFLSAIFNKFVIILHLFWADTRFSTFKLLILILSWRDWIDRIFFFLQIDARFWLSFSYEISWLNFPLAFEILYSFPLAFHMTEVFAFDLLKNWQSFFLSWEFLQQFLALHSDLKGLIFEYRTIKASKKGIAFCSSVRRSELRFLWYPFVAWRGLFWDLKQRLISLWWKINILNPCLF